MKCASGDQLEFSSREGIVQFEVVALEVMHLHFLASFMHL